MNNPSTSPGRGRRNSWKLGQELPGVRSRAMGVVAVSEAYLHAGQPEITWKTAQEHLAQVDAPSLLRLQLGKVAASGGVHREDGLATLDQVLREPLEGGSSGYPGAWWRKGRSSRPYAKKTKPAWPPMQRSNWI